MRAFVVSTHYPKRGKLVVPLILLAQNQQRSKSVELFSRLAKVPLFVCLLFLPLFGQHYYPPGPHFENVDGEGRIRTDWTVKRRSSCGFDYLLKAVYDNDINSFVRENILFCNFLNSKKTKSSITQVLPISISNTKCLYYQLEFQILCVARQFANCPFSRHPAT